MKLLIRRFAIVVGVMLLASWALFVTLIPRPGPVSAAIDAASADNSGGRVEIAKLTSFQWDEMFVVGSYAAPNEEGRRRWCEHVAFAADQCSQVKFAPVGDGWDMLVFRHRGYVVHSESHARANGTWYPFPAKQPLSPSDAVFAVMLDKEVSRSGKHWRYLVRPGDPSPPGSEAVAVKVLRP